MKKNTCTVCCFFLWMACCAQQNPIRLIVRGDDMGYSHSGNMAFVKSHKGGIQTAIEVIVPSPWFPEAVALLKTMPGVDVGIHLALTSEWDNVKWRPLTDCASLKDSNGYFFPMVYPNKNYPGQAILDHRFLLADVEKEFRAQIEAALKHLPSVSHLSGHMNCTHMTEEVRLLTQRLAREYKIPVELDVALENVTYQGPHQTAAQKKQAFLAMLDSLKPGGTYLFIDHPGLDDPELRAVGHIGYEQVAADRQGVTDLFTDPGVKASIKQKGIRLIGYKDLAGQKK